MWEGDVVVDVGRGGDNYNDDDGSDVNDIDDLGGFLRAVSAPGPASDLPVPHYRHLRSLYCDLCDSLGSSARPVEFHARFIRGGGDGGGGGGGGVNGDDYSDGGGPDSFVRSVKRRAAIDLDKSASDASVIESISSFFS